jgi:hypothetical protein
MKFNEISFRGLRIVTCVRTDRQTDKETISTDSPQSFHLTAAHVPPSLNLNTRDFSSTGILRYQKKTHITMFLYLKTKTKMEEMPLKHHM